MKKIHFTLLSLLLCLPAAGQSVTQVLQQVSDNNLHLKALRKTHQADLQTMRAENTLGETAVEYSPFFTSGVSGLATSELVVSQEVDFPTRFAARKRTTDKQAAANELDYRSARRNILLEAKMLCIDVIALKEQADYLHGRLAAADSLTRLMERRQQGGDATQLDINRIRIDRMEVLTAQAENTAALHTTLQSLQSLNGGQRIEDVTADSSLCQRPTLPLIEEMPEVRAAQAWQDVATQEVKSEQQGWLPRLTMGYRRNTEVQESLHGVLVGGALSLFSNGKRVRAARHRNVAAALRTEETRQNAQAQLQAQASEVAQLNAALAAYDEPLLHETLRLLMRAVQLGEIPITTYYTEADAIYRKLQERLDIQTRYRKALARLGQQDLW